MVLFLTLLSGAAWTIVYIVSIRVGFTQKTYAIPLAALALNIAWEWIYAVNGLVTDRSVQTYINLAWALADVVIVYTFFRYGRRELPRIVSRWMFIAWGVAVIAAAFVVQWLFLLEFGWNAAARYTAFLQNALMSGLFIAMFVARRGARGQSLVIGCAKWIGTLAPTIVFGALMGSGFILGLGILCTVFDLAYIGLLLWARQNPPAFDAGEDHRSPMRDPRGGPPEEVLGVEPAGGPTQHEGGRVNTVEIRLGVEKRPRPRS